MLGNRQERATTQRHATVLFMGDAGSGKSVLRQSVSPTPLQTAPLQFSYLITDNCKVLGYELTRGEILLDLVLKKENLDDALVVISVDLSYPSRVLRSLIRYLKILKEHVEKICPDRQNLNSRISWYNYSQYLNSDGLPRQVKLNTPYHESMMGQAASLSFGLKIILVGTRSETLNVDSEILDFMNQSIRAVSFLMGMPVLYISEEIPSTIQKFREYMLHYAFSRIYSSSLQVQNDDWGFPPPPEYLEREKTFIPAGWDERELIEQFSDQSKFLVSEYFKELNGIDFLDWANEYYSRNIPQDIKTKVEFNPVNEQDFLIQFSKLNSSEVTEETNTQKLPIQLNNLSTSAGSAQNEVLSNFFKSLLAKKA